MYTSWRCWTALGSDQLLENPTRRHSLYRRRYRIRISTYPYTFWRICVNYIALVCMKDILIFSPRVIYIQNSKQSCLFVQLFIVWFVRFLMRINCRSLVRAWESIQVETHGKYSSQRVLAFTKYARETTWPRAIIVAVVIPLPCLIVTLLIDTVPLSDPSEGIDANRWFFVREFYAFLVLTSLVICQFRSGLVVLPYPTRRVARDSVIISAITVGLIYGLNLTVGFPLPFTILTVMGVWMGLIVAAMTIQWAKKVRTTPRAGEMFLGMFKLWSCETLLVFIYPPYFFIYSTLSPRGQMAYTVLLPMIKLLMRNLFARAVSHLRDETPQLVVFNADVFGSLFVSYCMQNTSSFWATMVIMVADVVQMGFALREIEHSRAGLAELERQVDDEFLLNQFQGATGFMSFGDHKLTALQRASILLELEAKSTSVDTPLRPEPERVASSSKRAEPKKSQGAFLSMVMTSKKYETANKLFDRDRVHPEVNMEEIKKEAPAARRSSSRADKLYVRKVKRLLYMAEFLLLINYVEVIIPLVFSIYLVASYHLPNREYYAVYDGMSQEQLLPTLTNVLLYCLLQLISLLVLMVMLKRMLGHSPMQQISFVLEKQFAYLQQSLIVWLFYNVQTSLQHFGYDYTFRFVWLSNTTSSESN